jgi:type IV pilus assembly protein PilQ
MYFNKNANSELRNAAARSGVKAPPRLLAWLAGLVMLLSFGVLSAQELQDLRAANLGSGQTQLALQFSGTPPDASIFAIDSPPRIALDLPGVANRLAARTTEFNLGPLLSVTAVEAGIAPA